MIDVQRRDKSYSRFNLDYENLNNKLNVVKSRVIKTTGMRRASSALSLIDTRTFAEVLDQEVEKVVLFYIQEQGSIAKKVWQLRERQLLHLQQSDVAMGVIDNLFDSFRELGGEILSLLDYLDDNVIKLRKIISKHDTLFDQKMSSYYFDNKLGKSSRNQQLLPLYHQEGIQAIMSTIRRGFEDLYEAKDALSNPLAALPGLSSSSSSLKGPLNKTLPRVSFGARQLSYGNLQDSLSDKFIGSGKQQHPSNAGYRSTGNLQLLLSRTKSSVSRDSSLSLQTRPRPALSVSDMEPILRKIAEAASHLMETQQQSISEYLAATSLLALEVSVDDILLHRVDSTDLLTDEKMKVSHSAAAAALPAPPLYGLYVNLLITFLYLANQYVVAPTSGEYARLLGMSSALSGLIIGLTPAAALLSSLLYSMWSNYSFKDPIICCIVCAFVGNVFYGMALQWDAPWMILVGRLLTGFGGPRVISRRYIVGKPSSLSIYVSIYLPIYVSIYLSVYLMLVDDDAYACASRCCFALLCCRPRPSVPPTGRVESVRDCGCHGPLLRATAVLAGDPVRGALRVGHRLPSSDCAWMDHGLVVDHRSPRDGDGIRRARSKGERRIVTPSFHRLMMCISMLSVVSSYVMMMMDAT